MSEIVQVSLRGTRREFYLNSRNLWLRLRDRIIVQGEHGEALGTVFLKDPTLVALKRPGNVTREIIRKAEEEDLDQEDQNTALETEAFEYCRQRVRDTLADMTDERAKRSLPQAHRYSGQPHAWIITEAAGHTIEHASQIRQFITAASTFSES